MLRGIIHQDGKFDDNKNTCNYKVFEYGAQQKQGQFFLIKGGKAKSRYNAGK